jgi:hypothetical protein
MTGPLDTETGRPFLGLQRLARYWHIAQASPAQIALCWGEEMPVGISDARIRLYLDTKQPVELADLTLAFASFARQYRRRLQSQMRAEGKKIGPEDVKLYIAEIKTGSIEAFLAGGSDFFGTAFTLMDHAKIFIDFTTHIYTVVNYFSGKPVARPADLDKKDCDDFKDFLNLVAKARDGRLQLKVATFDKDGDHTHVEFGFNSEEAIEALKGAIKEKEQLERQGHADYEAVAMTWYQSNIGQAKEAGRTGDRGIIDDILPGKDLPVYFVGNTQNDKRRMLEDPFNHVFIVDVNVATANGEPRAYTIVRLHDILPLKDD